MATGPGFPMLIHRGVEKAAFRIVLLILSSTAKQTASRIAKVYKNSNVFLVVALLIKSDNRGFVGADQNLSY